MPSTSFLDRFQADRAANAGFMIAAAAALTLAGAWFFELVIGLEPCPLCLDQRIPYYLAVPLGLIAGWLARDPARAMPARTVLFIMGAALLIGAGYGVYHSGVEWGFWEGPAACAAGAQQAPTGEILSSLKSTTRVVPCNEAAWRFLGLSLAGYNVLIASALAALAFWTALNPSRRFR